MADSAHGAFSILEHDRLCCLYKNFCMKLTEALDFCFGVIYSYIASYTSSTGLIMTAASYRNCTKTQQTSWLNVYFLRDPITLVILIELLELLS